MKQGEERRCCKWDESWSRVDFEGKHTNIKIASFKKLSGLVCVCEHEMIPLLLHPVVLEVNLRTRWEITMGEREINNKLVFNIIPY